MATVGVKGLEFYRIAEPMQCSAVVNMNADIR